MSQQPVDLLVTGLSIDDFDDLPFVSIAPDEGIDGAVIDLLRYGCRIRLALDADRIVLAHARLFYEEDYKSWVLEYTEVLGVPEQSIQTGWS